MTVTPGYIESLVMSAVRAASATSARTAQSDDYRIGASEIGVCRSYIQRIIRQEERTEEDGIKWAAFIGQSLGASLETAVHALTAGEVVMQADVTATLPSGRTVPGHVDLYQPKDQHGPGWVLDFKAKDGLLVVERGEVDRSHHYQIVLYHQALVQAGLIAPDAPAFVVYVDRSGRDEAPVVKQVEVDDAILAEIDEWIDDAIYAHTNGTEAPRDRPYEWCKVACPFFGNCRGSEDEHDAQGLIEDPLALLAVEMYTQALAEQKDAERRKEQASEALLGVYGSTGQVLVSWTHVQGSDVSYYRRPYDRLNIRKIPTKKGKS